MPADYDMGIIRHRVTAKGHLLNAFPGLGFKAYLIRERCVDDSPVNQYAPFYLWASIIGMNHFLWGANAGFTGIIDSFGRPAVQHWTGVACELRTQQATAPCMATRYIQSIPENVDPSTVVNSALEELRQRARNPHVHSTTFAIDPKHWELVHFTLWNNAIADAIGNKYQVLHLSTPHLQDIVGKSNV